MISKENRKTIHALKVRQWLTGWDEIQWEPNENRAEPQHWFYQFSMPASEIKALSGVYRRTTEDRASGSQDLGIQRSLNRSRSDEINKFVQYGYPWSTLGDLKRQSTEYLDLRQPGWLPTAVVVNILTSSDERSGKRVDPSNLIEIIDSDDSAAKLLLPGEDFDKWTPKGIHPIEVIDGQHRLWAFEDTQPAGHFELPVVAFVGLARSWQAYLFYTINIKPKKINTSLAFDLYPLLRTEKWLEKFEGHAIYRETRAQELVDLLWSHPDSPWYHRINMLGETGQRGFMVTQASWVRALLSSFVKRWQMHEESIGGLFGSAVGLHNTVLRWTRTDQAAFLILAGQAFQNSIHESKHPWMDALRNQYEQNEPENENDPAFFGQNNLINTDQGNRVLLQTINDLCFVQADEIGLHKWGGDRPQAEIDIEEIEFSLASLRKEEIHNYLKDVSDRLSSYDWRTSNGPDLTEEERTRKAAFRGGGGYKELRRDVMRHIENTDGPMAGAASEVLRRLGY